MHNVSVSDQLEPHSLRTLLSAAYRRTDTSQFLTFSKFLVSNCNKICENLYVMHGKVHL
jgi:hypothetical protein